MFKGQFMSTKTNQRTNIYTTHHKLPKYAVDGFLQTPFLLHPSYPSHALTHYTDTSPEKTTVHSASIFVKLLLYFSSFFLSSLFFDVA